MAERRRRRKLTNNSGSDEGSDESEDEKKVTKSGSEVGDSEYESADEEELGEEEEELILVQNSGDLDDENKQLDDDEDRKNPQYIPKRGTFYEHDDRTAEGGDDLETTQESEEVRSEADVTGSKKDLTTSGKKKVWKEDDKWSHDKFIDYEQSPKTREELITIYGYDIRNEEGPPRARRRRRYGRGPNKYTRNWEDLDAYSKPSRGSPVPRGGGGGGRGNRRVPENTEEEFPALGSHHHNMSDGEHEHIQNEKYMHKGEREQSHHYDHKSSTDHLENHHYRDHPKNHTDEGRGRGRARGRGGSGGRGGQYKDSNRGHESNNTGRGSSRGGGGQQFRPQHISNREQLQEITAELKNVNIGNNQHQQQQQQQPRDEQQHHHNNHQQHRGRGRGGGGRGSVPPRMQDASSVNAGSNRGVSNNSGDGNSEGVGGSSRPKRYSSQRQRSIPDQPGSPYQGQHQGGYIDQGHEKGYGGYEAANNNARSNSSLSGQQQQPNFVPGPAAYTQGPNNFPAEGPFLGRPPAPRMFSPQPGPGPHMMPPGVAGSPVGVGGGVPRVVGPPGVGGVGVPPPGVAGPPVGVPTVGGPPVTGPPFLPAENLISYVGPPPPHPGPPHLGPHPAAAPFAGPPPPQFPPFQGYPPGPTSQPQEIYSNGVTYYNTQNQQVVPRVSIPLQKRPKAAIPIVPPPDSGSTNSIDQGSNSNDQDIETNDLQDESNPIESQEFIPAEQSPEIVKEGDISPVGQIKEELNGVEPNKTQIDLPSTEILKVQGQESSNEKKEVKENIIYNEKESLDEKLKDNTKIKESDTKEKVIDEKDINTTIVTEDKSCADGENKEAEVLVDTPVAAS